MLEQRALLETAESRAEKLLTLLEERVEQQRRQESDHTELENVVHIVTTKYEALEKKNEELIVQLREVTQIPI